MLVKEGDKVSYDTVVARAHISDDVERVPVIYNVGVEPYELLKVMAKKEGDTVREGEMLAVAKSLFELFTIEYRSPISCVIELISNISGMSV